MIDDIFEKSNNSLYGLFKSCLFNLFSETSINALFKLSNKDILSSVLKGGGSQSQQEVVAFNTALVLWAAGDDEDLQLGVDKAINSLEHGLPWNFLVNLRESLLTNIQQLWEKRKLLLLLVAKTLHLLN